MAPTRLNKRQEDRAVVLLLVLWIMVILSLIAYSIIFQVTTETSITSSRKKYLQAQALARAGVAKAIIDLRNDMLYDSVEEKGIFDAEGDVWARPEEGKQEVSLSRDEEDGYFNVMVYDEEAYFNLNMMTPANMMLLQEIIEEIGYNEDDARDVAAMIVDWRDSDSIPSLATSANGEEGIAFAILMNEDAGGETDPDEVQPIRFRNENYATVEELLEVPGVTPELFFGPDSEEAIYYSKIMPPYLGDRFQIEKRRRDRDEKPLGLRDYFTVYGTGRLNINTAPLHVLAAFAKAAGNTDGERWADRILRNRRGGKQDDFDNSRAYKSYEDVQADSEVQGILNVGGNLHPLSIGSTTFKIVSEGVVGDVRARFDVIAVREFREMQRVEDFEYMDRARERRDQNSGRYERRENRDDELRVQYPFVRIIQAYRN